MKNNKETILNTLFRKALKEKHQTFDEQEAMIQGKIVSRGYHTNAKTGQTVHSVRDTTLYAAALLYSGEEAYLDRALACIDRVLKLQDIDEKRETYGIWPYLLEEPVEAMSAPDWNMADFNAKKLLHILIDHRHALPEEMVKRVEAAVYHASMSIMRRNMGPDYTNISLMGAYVTIKAGEVLQNEELFSYGKRRLEKELEFVSLNGGYSEYNSPTYSILAIEEIGRMLKYIEDKECLETASQLHDLAWRSMAQHFHHPTRQLAAPHGRCYDNLFHKKSLSFLQIGTGMSLDLIDPEDMQIELLWSQIIIECPVKYYDYFKPIETPRFLKDKFYQGHDIISDDEIRVNIEKNAPDMEARTYMNRNFSLGSFTLYDFWNQRRPLMAYWGTADKPAYLQVRFLKNGTDFCSAMLRASQINNHVVAGVYFVQDHGDYHFILDLLKDGKIEAEELTVRFEVGGSIDNVDIPSEIQTGKSFDIAAGDISVRITPLLYMFEDHILKVKTGANQTAKWVDFVLYEGDSKQFDLNQFSCAAFLFGLSVFDQETCVDDGNISFHCEVNEEENTAYAEVSTGKERESITIPTKPSNYIEDQVPGLVRKVKCGGYIYE